MNGSNVFPFENLLGSRTTITLDQAERLRELVANWQLLSDLSFADLILWVPIRKDIKMWPSGHIAIAHIRPTTTATVFTNDVIGEEVSWGIRTNIDEALSHGEIIRDGQLQPSETMLIKEEAIPVTFNGQAIAVISRHRDIEHMRTAGKLEINYREIAHQLYRMVAEGNFPYKNAGALIEPIPRVGDGLIRLDVNGTISFASPNAKSAFSRMGWNGDLEGRNLGEAAQQVSVTTENPHE